MRRKLAIAGIVAACAVLAYSFLAPTGVPSDGSMDRPKTGGMMSWIFGRSAHSGAGSEASNADHSTKVKKSVRGLVVDAISKNPVAGASVELRKLDEVVAETTSDDDGRFGFADRYEAFAIAVHAAGYAAFAARIDASEENRLELDMAVRISGAVATESGDPVANADVWVQDLERLGWPPAESSHVRSGADGRFDILDAPGGRLSAKAEHEVFADGSTKIGGVAPGGSRDDVRIVVGATATITGAVRRSDGSPAEAVTVSWREKSESLRSEEDAKTDAAGRFTLHVTPAKGAVAAITDDGDATADAEAMLGRETHVELTLTAPQSLIGRVIDDHDEPVAGASIELAGRAGEKTLRGETLSDSSGRFELRAPAVATFVQITAKKDERVGKVFRRNGEELVVRLQAVGRLRVRTFGENGEKFPGKTSVYAKDGSSRRLNDIARDGDDVIITGPAGEWTVFAEVKDGATSETKASVTVAPPESVVTIVLQPPVALGTARGRLEGEDGEAIAGAHVSVARMDDGNFGALVREASVRTNASGAFALPAARGPQILFVYHPEHRSERVRMTMPASGDGDAGTIRLKRGRSSTAFTEAVGIGVQYGSDSSVRGPPRVRFVFEESPAEKAGIRAGDVLLEADGVSLAEMTIGDVVERMKGAEGTTVRLRVQREGTAPFVVDVVRAKFRT